MARADEIENRLLELGELEQAEEQYRNLRRYQPCLTWAGYLTDLNDLDHIVEAQVE